MQNFIAVFLGGGLGALLRYLVSLIAGRLIGIELPYATFIINITGSLFLGFVLALAFNKYVEPNHNLMIFLTVGLAGGFTTFSTYSYESLVLIRQGKLFQSALYLFLSPAIGLISVYIASLLGRHYN